VNTRLVLCYHALSDEWPAEFSVRPRDLEWQIRMLLERGYRGVTFSEAVSGECPPKSVAVTFDDAWRSVFDHGLPILARFGVPGTVFVPTDYPDRAGPMSWAGVDHWLGGPHEWEMRCMSWTELREMAGKGWEIGSHSCSHARLTTLDHAELERELERSREACAREIGEPCRSLAYPYGDCDARVIDAARVAGYTAAGALESKLAPGGALLFPRVGLYRVDDRRRFRLKVSSSLRLLRASPPWDAIAATRSFLAGGRGRFRQDPSQPNSGEPRVPKNV
jgi:peptidoglycan/xylan/chitin deacetylase (PgdA/CDA1 family)